MREAAVFDRYIQQLSSQDVETRRQAIIALGNSVDQRAMAALANVYKNDPDPALRELALKARRHIKRTTDSMQAVQPGQIAQAAPTPLANTPSQVQQAPKRTTGSMQAFQAAPQEAPLPKVSPFDMS